MQSTLKYFLDIVVLGTFLICAFCHIDQVLITDDFLHRLDRDLDELTRPKEVGNKNQSVPWFERCIIFFFLVYQLEVNGALIINN